MDEENETEVKKKRGRKVPDEVLDKRMAFYESNINDIVVNGAMAPIKNAVFEELARICNSNVNTEFLAAKKYAEKNDLFQKKSAISDDSDSNYTPFEGIGHGGEKHTINISGKNLFFDIENSKPKLISEFNDALIKIIFDSTRKPCAWSFGRIFTQNGEIKLHAMCLNKSCDATLVLYTENEQARMKLVIFNYDENVAHSKKRYLTDALEKSKVEALLQIETAMVARAKLANEYLFENNEYAAHLCSQAALKQRKHRMLSKTYRHENSTIAVQMMKREPQFMHTIQDIGLDPFFVFFALPLQQEYLLECTRRKRVLLSIDATGISIKPPQNSSVYYNAKGEQYKKSFLYLICAVIDSKHVPVFQVVSQRHSHDFIAYMLHYFKERVLNGKFPNEVMMDDSSALLLANILTFTNAKNMTEYLNQCYAALFEQGEPPKCYVRLDRAHFIKSLNDCKALNAVDKTKKKFYKRIMGYVMLCDDIEEVQMIIENVFILLKNEYLYNDRVVRAKNELEQLVKNHKSIIEDNTYEDYTGIQEIEMDQMLDTKMTSKFKTWVKHIETAVEENFVNQELNNSTEETDAGRNPYVSHQIIKTMSKMFARVALFSNVMNSVCGSENKSPSTSGTEAYFRSMKSFVYNLMKGIRFDTWLERSIEVTKGIFKALVSELKEAQKSEAVTDEQFDELCDNDGPQIEEENWKNLNVDAKKKKKKAVISHRNPRSILNPEKDEFTTISLLKNGGKSKKSGKTPPIFSVQTCGPDSYFHLFAACYADSPHFKQIIDQNDTNLAEFIRLLASPEPTEEFQEEIHAFRNRILLELFPETVVDIRKVKSIDCECGIADVYSRICKMCPVFNSLTIWPECCDNFIEKEFVKFHLLGFNVKKIQQAIRPIKTHHCSSCRKSTKVTQKSQVIVAFDAENSDDDVELNDIQREIEIDRIPYVLLGVIEHRPGHFIAHALRTVGRTGTQWVEYDDLKPKPIPHDSFIAKRVVLILYRNNEIQQPAIEETNEQIEPEAESNDGNELPNDPISPDTKMMAEADALLLPMQRMKVEAEKSNKEPAKKRASKRKARIESPSPPPSPEKQLKRRKSNRTLK